MAPKYDTVHGVGSNENPRYCPSSHDQSFSPDTQTDARIGSTEALRLFEIELAKLKQMGKPEQSTNNFAQTVQSHNEGKKNVQK